MDLKIASKAMESKSLPTDVSGLVHTVTDSNGDANGFANKFDENSLEKARIALNIGATEQVKMGADTPTEQDAVGQGMGDEDECMKSCGPDLPDCALLRDKLSLM